MTLINQEGKDLQLLLSCMLSLPLPSPFLSQSQLISMSFESGKGVHERIESLHIGEGNKLSRSCMDHPELSLTPSLSGAFAESSVSSSSESEANHCRKRKCNWDVTHTDIDLQVDYPLPFDWEQCLDLQSGRMYYMNKRTLKKSWNRPKERTLDLDLNISILPTPSEDDQKPFSMSSNHHHQKVYSSSNTSNMFAVACLKCHLLVMLSKSSPSCPNCKYVHPLPTQQNPPRRMEASKPLETLSLLN